MKDFKNATPADAGTGSDLESVDTGRRQALARLGLTAAIAYAAPALLPLTPASADNDSSGGGSSGHDSDSGGSDGHDDDSGGSDSDHGGGGDDDSQDDNGTGSTTPLPPSGSAN